MSTWLNLGGGTIVATRSSQSNLIKAVNLERTRAIKAIGVNKPEHKLRP